MGGRGCESCRQWQRLGCLWSEVSSILPGLFLGSQSVADNSAWLDSFGVVAVIRLRELAAPPPAPPAPPVSKSGAVRTMVSFAVDDCPSEADALLTCIAQGVRAIDAALIGAEHGHGHVLVHCYAGVSRSATLVAAYLMARYGWSDGLALAYIRSIRPRVNPNRGFLRMLRSYHHHRRFGRLWRARSLLFKHLTNRSTASLVIEFARFR